MTSGPLRVSPSLAALAAAVAVLLGTAQGDDPAAPAERIEILVLKNGDRVSGRSVVLGDGSLRWLLPYGREIDVPLALVDYIEQVPTDEELLELPPAPAAGPPPAPPAPDAPAAPGTEPAVPPPVEVPPVLAEPAPLTKAWYEAYRSTSTFTRDQAGKWTKRVELGGTWVDGNSETSEAYIGGSFERQFQQVFHQLEWNGRHATAGEKVTQSRWQFNGTTDLSKNENGKWIIFATHRHLFDELADVNYRGTYASGLGYRFVNEKEKRLIVRLGPGVTIEKYDPPLGSRLTPDLFSEAEAKWPVFDRTLLEYKGTFTPSLDDLGVFRMTSNYGLLVKLDDKEHWAMRVGLRHDHNSQPNPGKEENDFTTTFSVVYIRDKPKKSAD